MFLKIREKLKDFFKKLRKEEVEKEKEKIEEGKKFFSFSKISEEKFNNIWKDLELILLENNVPLEVVKKIKEILKERVVGKSGKIEKIIEIELKNSLEEIMNDEIDFIKSIKEKLKNNKPFKIVFFGINGTGKTTTIAKIAYFLKKEGLNCVLAASDTFRAASIEQLQKHAKNLKLPIVYSQYGADPASVAYDAIQHAKSKNIDVVLVDTAGRMHTEKNLMREMEKICKVVNPDLKIFVGESIAGNDIIEQIKAFNDSVGIDGIILTKADVDERGGACIGVGFVTRKPIFFLGTGQRYEDLEKFDKKKIIKQLFQETLLSGRE